MGPANVAVALPTHGRATFYLASWHSSHHFRWGESLTWASDKRVWAWGDEGGAAAQWGKGGGCTPCWG